MGKYKVSLVKCDSYNLEEVHTALKKSIDLLGGIEAFVRSGDRVLLKPNILIGKPPENCVNTHPSVIEAVINLVRECGGKPELGDSPGFGSAVWNSKRAGYYEVCRRHSVPIIEFDSPKEYPFEDGYLFKKIEMDSHILDYDRIINLAKLKTHGMMMLTLAVKNMFGVVSGYKKLHWHMAAKDDYSVFARFLIDLCRFASPSLNILDAVYSMEGNGPQSGQGRKTGFLSASESAHSLDRVICDIVRFKPEDVPVIDSGIKLGIPEYSIENIEIEGESIESLKIKDFKPPRKNRLTFYKLPGFVHRIIDRFILIFPRVNDRICTRCGICIKSCPADAIRFKSKPGKEYGKSVEIDYHKCIRCYCCQEMCPEGAIRLK